ncbi:hypothetical protein EDB85DRAFT_549796 [Lactarius pseudohatsudake]|nr:hypothetical protein EDB85DRAFT_549796 [Lactarius pseudohatsudake]
MMGNNDMGAMPTTQRNKAHLTVLHLLPKPPLNRVFHSATSLRLRRLATDTTGRARRLAARFRFLIKASLAFLLYSNPRLGSIDTASVAPAKPQPARHARTTHTLTVHSDPQPLERDTVSAWGILLSTSTRSHILGPSVKYLGSLAEHGFYIVTMSVDRTDILESS